MCKRWPDGHYAQTLACRCYMTSSDKPNPLI
jgi:hypothetical protein